MIVSIERCILITFTFSEGQRDMNKPKIIRSSLLQNFARAGCAVGVCRGELHIHSASNDFYPVLMALIFIEGQLGQNVFTRHLVKFSINQDQMSQAV